MKTCNCGCNPSTATSGQTCSTPICKSTRIAYVKGYDENGCEVALTGNGLLAAVDGNASYTDGSDEEGRVKLAPPSVNGVPVLLGVTTNGDLVSVGENASEGSTLIYSGGFWTPAPISQSRNLFQASSLKTGVRVAAWTCSNLGAIEIAYLQTTPATYLYINEDGLYEPRTIDQMNSDIVSRLCEAIPVKTDDEAIAAYIGCTEDGKIVKSGSNSGPYYLNPIALIYSQLANNGPAAAPGGIVNIPPGATLATPGVFTTNFVDVDLATLPGYSPKAHSVVIMLRAGILNAAFGGNWDLVGVIQGIEHIRVSCGQANDVRKLSTEVMVKIPEGPSKVIRCEGIRQVATGGPSVNEFAGLDMFLKAFLF